MRNPLDILTVKKDSRKELSYGDIPVSVKSVIDQLAEITGRVHVMPDQIRVHAHGWRKERVTLNSDAAEYLHDLETDENFTEMTFTVPN